MDVNQLDKRITAITSALISKIVNQELKIRVLEELLIDKGKITFEELEEKYKFIQDRDFDDLKLEMMDSLSRYERGVR